MIEQLEIVAWSLNALDAAGLPVSALDAGGAGAVGVLVLLTGLLVKHFICDFLLQTGWQVRNKGRYGHPGGILHSALHSAGTAPFLLGLSMPLLIGLLIAEFVLHYHLDWAKEQIGKRAGWTPTAHAFWIAMGADQLAHGLSYLGLVAFIVFVL